MTYLSRPVFDFPINWGDPVNKSFAYDQRRVALGFGAPVSTTLQAHVTQGFDLSLWLKTPAEITAYDAFTAALAGRLVGFWLPAPFEAGQIVNVVSTTVFDIKDQKLRDTFADHPDQYLFFTKAGQTSVAAKITGVVLSGSVERVTVNAAVGFLDVATVVRRLHYVRLADDVERATFLAEGWQRRDVRVVELPLEYAAIETGEKKIFLYKFWCPDPVGVSWYFTSFAAPVYSGGNLHTPANIEHRGRRQGIMGDDALDVECTWDASHPLALFFPVPLSAPMWFQLSETTYADPDTVTLLFTGRVGSPTDKGDRLSVKCETFGALLKRKVPRGMISPVCNNQLFDVNCRVNAGVYKTVATIKTNNSATYPPTVLVTLDGNTAARQAVNYFAQGWIESRGGLHFEIRTILASSYNPANQQYTLTLNLGLLHAAADDRLGLAPGCDGAAATCKTKFNNYVNFFGFPAVPNKNLALASVDQETNVGNKK